MRKVLHIVYIVFFVLLCSLPLCLWPFFENETPINKSELAEMPSITNEDGSINTNYFDEFDDYFTDHLPFRPQLVSADNFLKAGLLGGDAANVVTGKDGYLFSNLTVDSYVGNTYSERKLNNIVRTIEIMQDKVESSGCNFVFTVAPDKNSVYPQFMPDRYTAGTSNLDLLEKLLAQTDINYADMRSTLKNAGGELYLKTDTHWNNLGALYGFNTIMDALGKEHKDYNGVEYTIKNNWYGDLAQMLYPSGTSSENQYYFDINCDDVMFMSPRLGLSNADTMANLMGDSEENDTLIMVRNPNAQGSLLMVRDSFGRGMLPFLIDNYGSATITRSQPFSLSSLTPDSGTDVVYEIVERNLDTVVDSAPVMSADECAKVEAAQTFQSDKNFAKVDMTASYVKLYGELDESVFDSDSEIYVVVSDGGTDKFYRAFPIYEAELLGDDSDSDYGFSVSLDKTALEGGSYRVGVVITNDEGNISTGTLAEFTV